MNKIDKIEKELEKAREKAAEWQAKIRDLEKQKQEEENSQIVQAVRSLKLTPAELMAFLNDPKNAFSASGHIGPKSEGSVEEVKNDEENEIDKAGLFDNSQWRFWLPAFCAVLFSQFRPTPRAASRRRKHPRRRRPRQRPKPSRKHRTRSALTAPGLW